MYKIAKDGLIIDSSDGRPVAVFVDSCVTALGVGTDKQLVMLRLYHKDWKREGPLVPGNQLHQFALPAPRAAELGRLLLELAAQAEKEAKRPQAH